MKTINIEVTPKDVIKAKAKKPDSKWLTVYQIPLTLFVLNDCEFSADAIFTRDGQFFDSVFMVLIKEDKSIGGMFQ